MRYPARASLDMVIQAAGLNEFQQQLSLDQIYVKNESISVGHIKDNDKLKILTWNIERGADPDALAAYINQVRPDIVCLQEVDWGNQRTNYIRPDLINVCRECVRVSPTLDVPGENLE